MPPSSSGPGHGPLKAKTGVRVPLGAQKNQLEHRILAGFFIGYKAIPISSILLYAM